MNEERESVRVKKERSREQIDREREFARGVVKRRQYR